MNNDSPDLKAARTVAEYIETEHYEIFFNENDIMEVIDEVIRTIETYDISAVRASICKFIFINNILISYEICGLRYFFLIKFRFNYVNKKK